MSCRGKVVGKARHHFALKIDGNEGLDLELLRVLYKSLCGNKSGRIVQPLEHVFEFIGFLLVKNGNSVIEQDTLEPRLRVTFNTFRSLVLWKHHRGHLLARQLLKQDHRCRRIDGQGEQRR